jgi:hypothetical protein
MRLLLFAPANESKPPTFTVVPLNWIRGFGLVLVKFERVTDSKLKSALSDPPLTFSNGPDNVTLEGATNSFAGAPLNVSETAKTLPPDCRSIPVKVELESWIRGAVVVSVS